MFSLRTFCLVPKNVKPHFGWLLRRCSPLPIPNREVKPACADGTAMQCGRVGGRLLLEARVLRIEISSALFFLLFIFAMCVRSKHNIYPLLLFYHTLLLLLLFYSLLRKQYDTLFSTYIVLNYTKR